MLGIGIGLALGGDDYQERKARAITVSAALQKTTVLAMSGGAVLKKNVAKTLSINSALQKAAQIIAASANSILQKTTALTTSLNSNLAPAPPAKSLSFTKASTQSLTMSDANFGAFNLAKFAIALEIQRATASGSTTFTLMCQQGVGGTDLSFKLDLINDAISFTTSVDGVTVDGQIKTNATYTSTSTFYRILVWFDSAQAAGGDRMRMFVDGPEITSFAIDTNPTAAARNSGSSVRIGANGLGTTDYDGLIYNLALFSGSLPTAAQLWQGGSGSAINPTGITGLWSNLDVASNVVTHDAVISTAWTNVNTVVSSSTIP